MSAYEATHDDLQRLRDDALAAIAPLNDRAQIDQWRIEYIGRNGALTGILRGIKDRPPEERGELGAAANRVKQELNRALEEGLQRCSDDSASQPLDFDAPALPPRSAARRGGPHISAATMERVVGIFEQIGFQAVEGPEVEQERYNFDMLNIPADHPARDLMDTIWIESQLPLLLRTHTSPMQIRTMEATQPPVRVVVPGKCFRHEATDASHEWQFHQIEGLAVGRGITFANMRWVFEEFVHRLFGADRHVRLRCDYFPFVEPGVDVSVDCFACSGGGCSLCHRSGWIEIMGAGMVHPRVLSGVGYNPDEVSGFAFGLGTERIAMLLHKIGDIRNFFQNNLNFLEKFGAEPEAGPR